MPFKFVAEMPDSRSHGPGSRIAQRANGIAFNLALNIPQQVNVTHLAFAVLDVGQDLFHPTRSFTAGRALSAAFMTIKPSQGHGMTHHALVFIHHDKPTRAHHGAGSKT